MGESSNERLCRWCNKAIIGPAHWHPTPGGWHHYHNDPACKPSDGQLARDKESIKQLFDKTNGPNKQTTAADALGNAPGNTGKHTDQRA